MRAMGLVAALLCSGPEAQAAVRAVALAVKTPSSAPLPVAATRLDAAPSAALLHHSLGAPIQIAAALAAAPEIDSPTAEAVSLNLQPEAAVEAIAQTAARPGRLSGSASRMAAGIRSVLGTVFPSRSDAGDITGPEAGSPKPPLPPADPAWTRPETFIPSAELSYPRISIRRALKHISLCRNGWSDKRVFQVPLTSSDHLTLTVLSYVWGFLSPLSWYATHPLIAIPIALFSAMTLSTGHVKEWRDARTVVANAKNYHRDPQAAAWDDALLDKARRFQRETGWTIAWTDDPRLLAKPELGARRVVMSLGWVVKSDVKRHRRRLAYLNSVLRTVRHAIEDLPAKASSQPES